MDAEYTYAKRRKDLGKRCSLSDVDTVEIEIKSNPGLMSNYVRTDPVTHATQCSKVYALHEVCLRHFPTDKYFCSEYMFIRSVVSGEHDYRDIQRQQDVSLRGWLAERYQYERLGADSQIQAQDREGRAVHSHDASIVACKSCTFMSSSLR